MGQVGNQQEATMSETAAPTQPKLPEVPFDGVVVSVDKGPINDCADHLDIAIMGESSDPEKPVIVFYGCRVRLIDPRRHLCPGHKVRVKRVALATDVGSLLNSEDRTSVIFTTPIIVATVIEVNVADLFQAPQSKGGEDE
jgi:hypothetical protein